MITSRCRLLSSWSLAAVLAVALLALPAARAAAAPLTLGVQADLMAPDGGDVDGAFSLTFTLYDGSEPGANVLWTETLVDVDVQAGALDVALGGTASLTADVFIDAPAVWLGVRVDAGPGVPTGGEGELPRRPLTAVAYAFSAVHADTAATANGLACAGCVEMSALAFDVATQAEFEAAAGPLSTSVGELTTRVGSVESTLAQATMLADALEATVATLGATVGAQGSTLTGLQTGLDAAVVRLGLLDTAAASTQTALASLDASVATHTTDVAALQTLHAQTTAAVAALQTDLMSAKTQLSDLAASLTTAKAALTDLTVRVTTLEGHVLALQGASSAHGSAIVALEAVGVTMGSAITGLQAADVATAGAIGALQAADATTATAITAIQGADVAAATATTALTTRVGALEPRVDALEGATTLDEVPCAAGQAVVKGPDGWTCQTIPTIPTPPTCTGSLSALQWTGSAWQCVTISGAPSGIRGFPFTDRWGNVFDGLERKPASFDVAKASCESVGGRLPTLTELWRVSWARTGELGTAADTGQLWTRVTGRNGILNTRFVFRLSDALTGEANMGTGTFPYRCIWPIAKPDTYSGAACNGPPGAECLVGSYGRGLMNVDASDHAPMSYWGAKSECAFAGGSVPTLPTLVGALSTVAGKATVTGKTLVANDGYVSWPSEDPAAVAALTVVLPDSSVSSFRCSGPSVAYVTYPNTLGANLGAAAVDPSNGSVSHASDLPNFEWETAVSDCLARGGALPDLAEWRQLTDLPLSAITGKELWAAAGRVQPATQYVAASLFSKFGTSAEIQVSPGTVPYRQYRCLFRALDLAYTGPAACNGGAETCFSVSGGAPTPVVRWADPKDRFPDTQSGALATCAAEGGRLPTYGELVGLIRAGLPNGTGPTKTLWTTTLRLGWVGVEPGWTPRIATPTTSGVAGDATTTGLYQPFRCVWSNERY